MEPTQTTNISMMDNKGNMIATTQTINGLFGAMRMVPNTGVILNNEMDDFSLEGHPNNLPAAGGVPRSSMAPTLILKKSKPMMVVGAPGGTQIPSCISQAILAKYEFNLKTREILNVPKVHFPQNDKILMLESVFFASDFIERARSIGPEVKVEEIWCLTQAVSQDEKSGLLEGVADPRDDAARVGVLD